MTIVYKAVLQHAIRHQEHTTKVELTKFLNTSTSLNIIIGGLAIDTIIRQAYNYYINKNKPKKAILILKAYKADVYLAKVLK
jgi:hypothetical protein